jgi:glycosyltransferase involved in cell wall biosynthesis
MKKIVIFVPTIKSGGAEKQAALLAKVLSKKYLVSFVVFYGEVTPAKTNEDILRQSSSLKVYYLKGNYWRKTKEFIRIIKREQIDIAFNYLTFCDTYGAIMEKIAGVRTIYNGIRNSRLPKAKLFFERLCHNHISSGTVFNCYSGAEYFKQKKFNANKCIVVQNCFPNIAEPITRNNEDVVTIITIGRFVEQKDYETSLKTIALLKQKQIPLRYIIIGYGELYNDINKWISDYALQDDVSVLLNPKNVQEILSSSDIYLSSSIFEGTSNSIMEALNWSIPVVATNVGDNEYLVENSYNGFLKPIGDAEGLAKSLACLIENIEKRNEMGQNGNRLLKDNFSEELFEQRYIEIIEGR